MSQTPEERARERHRTGECGCDFDSGAWCGYVLKGHAAQDRENDVADGYRQEGRRAAFAECRKMVEAEPELPGAMPDAVWDRMRDSRQASEECLRAAVRATKRNILANLTTMEESCTPNP